MSLQLKDRAGIKYAHWSVISLISNRKVGNKTASIWMCVCECGNTAEIQAKHLSGRLRVCCQCGAGKTIRVPKHGKCGDRIYSIWSSMLMRCRNSAHPSFARYGAKGVKVCSAWIKFENFYSDMGDPPSTIHSIDRIDPYGNYELSNCRWATPTEQANNRKNNRKNNRVILFNGNRKTMSEWARLYGLSKTCLLYRSNSGWEIEKALMRPSQRIQSQNNHVRIMEGTK